MGVNKNKKTEQQKTRLVGDLCYGGKGGSNYRERVED